MPQLHVSEPSKLLLDDILDRRAAPNEAADLASSMKETELSVTVLVNGWFAEHLRQLKTEGERQAARAKGAQGVLMAAWQRELQAPVMLALDVKVVLTPPCILHW